MYVCLCKGVTDKQLRDAVRHGAQSVRAVSEATGAMTQCGKCACDAIDIIKSALEVEQNSTQNNQRTSFVQHENVDQKNDDLFFEVA